MIGAHIDVRWGKALWMTACKPMAVPAWPENGDEVPTDPATVECLLFDVLQLKALWVRRMQ